MKKEDKKTIVAYVRSVKGIGHFRFDDIYEIVFPNRDGIQFSYDYRLIAEVAKVIEGTLPDNAEYLRITEKGTYVAFWRSYTIGSTLLWIKKEFGGWGSFVSVAVAVLSLYFSYHLRQENNRISKSIDSLQSKHNSLIKEVYELSEATDSILKSQLPQKIDSLVIP